MKDYKDLLVWLKSHLFKLAIYQFTKTSSKEEKYGLTSQIRRCSVLINPISQKAAENYLINNSLTFNMLQADRPQNWTINLCFQKTFLILIF